METLKINLVVGNDNGNSEHDIIIDGNLITQPNVISRVRKAPYIEELNSKMFIEKIENNLITDIVSDEVQTGTYLCGKYALSSGETVRTIAIGYDNDKVHSNIVMVNTLSQVAGAALKKAFKETGNIPDCIEVNADMATALPIGQYSKKSANEFSDRFVGKLHSVTVHTPEKKVLVKVVFDFVKVLPEGITTLFALSNAEDNLFAENNAKADGEVHVKLSKEYFNKKRILHIAVGEGTTEYPITDGKAFNPSFIHGSNHGLGHAINKSLDEFKTECGQTSMSRQKYSEILKDKKHKFHDLALDIIDIQIEEQAEEIFQNAKNEIDKANNEIDIICVYGGGSILMRKHLEPKLEKICKTAKIHLFYVDEKNAVTLEADGLYSFVTSPFFSQVKKHSLNK